ncbi:BatD family protein [Pseudomonas segetis]|uniref:Oxygen tolerance n=1 Tax=Pseudomonas segetis TaxID=298908 RepID=A0A238ZFY3_9PSED|nr:BatD family protein [Pseudomonas segetis]SNR81604.1 Oxygen tolerance [Pseudomonas segetis]
MKRLILLLVLLLPWPALADEPSVLVDSRLVPEAQVLVGGTINLEVDLLVDTWFTSAPQLPKLELPGAIVSAPSSEATHLTQRRQGKTFFGLRFTYRITPQQAQTFDIPALSIQLQPGQGSKPQTVQTQAQSFNAVQPVGASHDKHVLVAKEVTFTQNIVRSHDPLRVGDSISRQLNIRAIDAQALLIPAPEAAEIEGLKHYVQTPEIQPLDDGRGGITGGIRNDTLTYVVSEPGNYTLPAIELKWWNQAGQQQTASVPKVSFKAQGQSSYSGPFSISEDLRQLGRNTRVHIARHWLLLSGLTLFAVAMVYFGRPYWQRGWQSFLRKRAARRQAWLDSPDYAWQQLLARLNDQTLPLDELYRWLKRDTDENTFIGATEDLPSHLREQLLTFLNDRYALNPSPLAGVSERKKVLSEIRKLLKQRRSPASVTGQLKPLNPTH